MKKYIYGLDFGTSNSALSIIDVQQNKIVKTFSERSLIYFPKPPSARHELQPAIGQNAVEQYVDSRMNGRFMKSLKRILPISSFEDTKVFGRKFTAEDLVALIIGHLKQKADDFLGQAIDKVVMGRPVFFDEKAVKDQLAQKRLAKAARLAGFQHIHFQLEPIAAAFTYERNIQKEEIVLVADFGGGTSDFTLMRLSPERLLDSNRQQDIIAKGGIYIGGDAFDSDIMWQKITPHFGRGLEYQSNGKSLPLPITFYTNITTWEKMNFYNSFKTQNALKKYYFYTNNSPQLKKLMSLTENNLGYDIFQHIEQAKIKLSLHDKTTFHYQQYDIDIQEIIDIQSFTEKIVQKNMGKIDQYLANFLAEHLPSVTNIDSVFMTGGTSLVRPIQQMIDKHLGKHKIRSGDNFNSVVNGLAYSSVLFFD